MSHYNDYHLRATALLQRIEWRLNCRYDRDGAPLPWQPTTAYERWLAGVFDRLADQISPSDVDCAA